MVACAGSRRAAPSCRCSVRGSWMTDGGGGARRPRRGRADDGAHASPAEHLIRQIERAQERNTAAALRVTEREQQLRVGQQMVGDAIRLVVDFLERQVEACEAARPGGIQSVARCMGLEDGEQSAHTHNAHARLWRVRRPRVVLGR
eukprot:7391455-Prymnesium_polylepis.5